MMVTGSGVNNGIAALQICEARCHTGAVTDEPKASSPSAAAALADKAFGERLRALRNADGLTLDAVCQRMRTLGVEYMNPSTLSRIETGARPVRLAEALVISRIFEVSLEAMNPTHDDLRTAQTLARQARDSYLGMRRAAQNFARLRQSLVEKRDELEATVQTDLTEGEQSAYMEVLGRVEAVLSLDAVSAVEGAVGKRPASTVDLLVTPEVAIRLAEDN